MIKAIIVLSILFGSWAFLNIPNIPIRNTKIQNRLSEDNACNERVLYRNYLLGLRQLRRTTKSITNVEALMSFVNFTNNYISNTSLAVANNTQINNEESHVKTLIMANMQIDVSNIKTIYIHSKNDILIVELDKKNKLTNILNDINNVDTLINTLSMLVKVVNIN
jgi:hypothetical protein